MAFELWNNNAASALAAPIGAGDVSITVSTGHGSRFPSPSAGDWFWVTLDSGSSIEVCKCTGRSGDVLSVVRGQQGTTALAFVSAAVENRVTKSTLEGFLRSQTSLTSGSILFAGTAGDVSQDNANLFWDDTNNRLGIGTTSPQQSLHVASHSRFDGTIYAVGNLISASGDLTVGSTGGSATISSSAGADVILRVAGAERARFSAAGYYNRFYGSSTATGFASSNKAEMWLQNLSNTTNNWVEIQFFSSTSGLTSGIGSQTTDHTNLYGELAFFTRGSGGFGERVRVKSDGKIGVGTTSPLWQMTLVHATSSEIALMNGSNSGGTIAMIHASNALYISTNGAKDLVFQTSGTERMRLRNSVGGWLGIGLAGATELDMLHITGKFRSASVTTDATTKTGYFVGGHYTNSEEPIGAVVTSGTSSTNVVMIGGGDAAVNAATMLKMFVAANYTTTTGTEIFRANTTGVCWSVGSSVRDPVYPYEIIGNTNGTSRLMLKNTNNAASTAFDVVFGDSTGDNIARISYYAATQATYPKGLIYQADYHEFLGAGGGTSCRIEMGAAGVMRLGQLTASQAVFTDPSKNLVSVATTGSGNVVLATSPTITTPSITGTTTSDGIFTTSVTGTVGAYRATGQQHCFAAWVTGVGGDDAYVAFGIYDIDLTSWRTRILKDGSQLWAPSGGSTVASMSTAGLLTVANLIDNGLTASQGLLTDVNKKLVSVDLTGTGKLVRDTSPTIASATLTGATLDNTSAIQSAKGHRFWIFGSGANPGVNGTLNIPIGNFDSITYPHGIVRACKVVKAQVSIIHYDASPPATWTMDIYKNGSSASSMSFNLNANPYTNTTTVGTPSALTLAAGDTIGYVVYGTSIDTPIVNVTVEFETTS